MNKLNYLKKTVETYVVVDPNTRGQFKITVTEGVGDIHFEMEHSRVMSAEGVGASIELLKQLIQNDCFNPVARDGERKGKMVSVKTDLGSIDLSSTNWSDQGEAA